jgi:glycosyltransferase involved in cell wall biosynthesis
MKLLIAADKTRFHNLKQFADELVKYGIEYKLIDDSDIYDAPNILHKYSRWFKTPKKFQKIITEFKPDAIFTERYSRFSLLVIKHNIPLWIYMGGDHWTEIKQFYAKTKISTFRKIELWYKNKISEKCFRESEIIFVDDEYMKKIVKNRFPNKKIGLMFQGIKESEWIENEKMVLKHPCVGLLQRANVWGKTEEMLILPKIIEAFPEVTFYWAGDGQYRNEILAKLKKYKNFEWLGSLEYPDKVKKYLASIDVYALLSGLDTSPHSVLEAGLMKKPIVATNVGGVSEIIINEKTGFIVKKGNYNEYIEKISILINDEKKRKEIGNNEYEYVKNNFTWEIVVKNFISVINN